MPLCREGKESVTLYSKRDSFLALEECSLQKSIDCRCLVKTTWLRVEELHRYKIVLEHVEAAPSSGSCTRSTTCYASFTYHDIGDSLFKSQSVKKSLQQWTSSTKVERNPPRSTEKHFRKDQSYLQFASSSKLTHSWLSLRFLVEYPLDRFLPVRRHECQRRLPLPILYVRLSTGLYQEPADFFLPFQAHGARNRGGHVQRRVVHVISLVHVRSGSAQQHLLNETREIWVQMRTDDISRDNDLAWISFRKVARYIKE